MKRLIYLHGFLSSPKSLKAQQTKRWLTTNRPDIFYQCPALSSYPGLAIQQIQTVLSEDYEQTMLVGSSLGGYWCTWLTEVFGFKSVVINPAVEPSMFRGEFLGVELQNYSTDETYILGENDVNDLKSVFVDKISDPSKIWLMAQQGDEVCDYRLAEQKYLHCRQTIEEGGDHAFQGFENWLPEIIDFLEI